MLVSSVNVNQVNSTQKAAKLGSTVGVGVGAAYLIKNRQDIFVNTIKQSVKEYGSKKNGIIGCAVAGAATLLATTGIGAAVGGVIGKIVDTVNSKKAEKETKQMLAEMLQKQVDSGAFDNVKSMSIDEACAQLDYLE